MRRSSWYQAALLFFGGVAITGCASGSEDPVEADSGLRSGTLAIVQLERWSELVDAPAHLVADAKVARYHGIDGRDVQRLLGGHTLDGEHCALASSESSIALGLDTAVELLDVGDIQLALGSLQMSLTPRVFPALAGAAGGVFYAADTDFAAPAAQDDEYRLAAPGAEDVGAFDIALLAPSQLEDVAFAGKLLALGTERSEPTGLVRGNALAVTWAALDPRDRVEVEIASGRDVLTCVGRDDGHMTIGAPLLRALSEDADASLTVRRVRLAPLDMQGVDVAYVRAVAASVHGLRVK